MAKIRVGKDRLLGILEENKKSHHTIFEEALEGYRKAAIEWFNEQIATHKAGRTPKSVYFPHHRPDDHTKDYEKIIRMYNMAEDDDIVLSEEEYTNYVEDNWGWKQNWSISNSQYSSTLTAQTKDFDEDDD